MCIYRILYIYGLVYKHIIIFLNLTCLIVKFKLTFEFNLFTKQTNINKHFTFLNSNSLVYLHPTLVYYLFKLKPFGLFTSHALLMFKPFLLTTAIIYRLYPRGHDASLLSCLAVDVRDMSDNIMWSTQSASAISHFTLSTNCR